MFVSLEVGAVTKPRGDTCRVPSGICVQHGAKSCTGSNGGSQGSLPVKFVGCEDSWFLTCRDNGGGITAGADTWHSDGRCDEGPALKIDNKDGPSGGCTYGTDCTDCDNCDDDDVVWPGAHIEKNLTNLTPSRTYLVTFTAALRPGYGQDQSFEMTVNGHKNLPFPYGAQKYSSKIITETNNGKIITTKLKYDGNNWPGFTNVEVEFTTPGNNDGTALLRFENTSPRDTYPDSGSGFAKVRGDKRVFIDEIKVEMLHRVAAPSPSHLAANHGFERHSAISGNKCYNWHPPAPKYSNCPPAGTPMFSQACFNLADDAADAAALLAINKWTKSKKESSALVAQNCVIWGNLDSGFGKNYVAITGPGTFIRQTMSHMEPGEVYEINFLAASRPNSNGKTYTGEKLKVVIDGVDVFPSMLLPEIGFQRYRARFVHMPEYDSMGWSGCTSSAKCGKCGGDCDNDGECEAGLKCWQRASGNPAPGCAEEGMVSGVDYCYYEKGVNTKAEVKFVNDSPNAVDTVFVDDIHVVSWRPY